MIWELPYSSRPMRVLSGANLAIGQIIFWDKWERVYTQEPGEIIGRVVKTTDRGVQVSLCSEPYRQEAEDVWPEEEEISVVR